MSNIIAKLNGERFLVFGLIFAAFLMIWFLGCESQVTSMFEPETKVTREVLSSEVDLFLARAEEKYKILDQKDAFKTLLTNQAALVAQGNTINPLGLLTTIMSIIGVGAVVDNVRKNRKLKTLTEPSERPTA